MFRQIYTEPVYTSLMTPKGSISTIFKVCFFFSGIKWWVLISHWWNSRNTFLNTPTHTPNKTNKLDTPARQQARHTRLRLRYNRTVDAYKFQVLCKTVINLIDHFAERMPSTNVYYVWCVCAMCMRSSTDNYIIMWVCNSNMHCRWELWI